MMLRIFASLALIFSIFFLPFWVSAILALIGMIYFSFFVEAIFIFLIADLLYGTQVAKLNDALFVSFIIAILVLIITEILKNKLRFNI